MDADLPPYSEAAPGRLRVLGKREDGTSVVDIRDRWLQLSCQDVTFEGRTDEKPEVFLLRILNESTECIVLKNVRDKDGRLPHAQKEEVIRHLGRLPNGVYRECLCLFDHGSGGSYLKNSDREGADLKIVQDSRRRSWTKTLSFGNLMDQLIPFGDTNTDKRHRRVGYYQVRFDKKTQLWTLKCVG